MIVKNVFHKKEESEIECDEMVKKIWIPTISSFIDDGILSFMKQLIAMK